MIEFLFDYGLFTAKALTIILLIAVGLAFFVLILASRQKERESIEIEHINEKFDDLKHALQHEILSKDELKKLAKAKKKHEKSQRKNPTPKPRLFVLRFDGDIHATDTDNLRSSVTALLTVATPKDEVCLVLESAGGVVHQYGLAASQLTRLKAKNIKLTAAVDLVAASGGYLMACVADRIIAAPFAVLGSIGVLAQVPNFNRALDRLAVDIEHHTAGEHKTTLTMLGKNTDKGREKFRQELNQTHGLFKDFVKTHRSELDLEVIANGDHWYGSQALDLKLIDEIKTSDDYLLEKSATMDIYEVKYKIHQSIKEKFNTMFFHARDGLLRLLRWVSPKSKLDL